VPAGHDEFDYDLVQRVMGTYTPWHVKNIAGQDKLNMTVLGFEHEPLCQWCGKKARRSITLDVSGF
jgi:hypothetical protein